MPEGDTIHHAAAQLRRALVGRVPEEIVTPHPRHGGERWPARLAGRAVRKVDAHGKHLFVRFEGDLTLHSHLRMTGAWDVHAAGLRWRRPPRRAWLVLRTDGWEAVEFDGPVLELMPDARTRTDPRLAALGQDVLGESFDERRFLGRLRGGEVERPIGDALIDQRVVAGIGNYWKSEACFAAGVAPGRAQAQVSDEQALALVRFAREHMRESAREGYQTRPHAVYRRAGQPCPRCATPIRGGGQGENNRATYWCPRCQK